MLETEVNTMLAPKLIVFILLTLLTSSHGELFTALVDLEKLLYTEEEVIKTLDQYLASEEQRLQKVRWLQGQFSDLHQRASDNVESFLSNPVNAYLLVKRLTADWREAENLVQGMASKALIENITFHRQDLKFPDDEDLSGAAIALMRLQDVYKLNTSALAQGLIEGSKPSPELTAGDCFELGKQAYNAKDFYHTLLWMQEALDRLGKEHEQTADHLEVMEYTAYSAYMQGNIEYALQLTKDLLDTEPSHQRALGNLEYYQQALLERAKQKRGDAGDDTEQKEPEQLYIAHKPYSYPNRETYERLCRGEKVPNEKPRGRFLSALFPKTPVNEILSCRYFTNNNPVLFLQPVKEEEMCSSPRILMYHDILSEKEMDIIKTLAQPLLKRATVQTNDSDAEIAPYRISKSAWLKNEEDKAIARISQRIEDITGLAMYAAEELQVVNYGIGGHYEPHTDFATDNEPDAFKALGMGNRIATWLNYMSNVEAGGATVFPEIGVSVKPVKGSAAFWYNLFKSGRGDFRTRHAACPVLVGSKWVSNKWVHEYGQEFRRSCSLNELE